MKVEIAKTIYLKNMEIMKKVLDLGGFKLDKRTKEYTYFKSEVMNYFYNSMGKLFKYLEENKIIKLCPCKTNIRKGYKKCSCGGSGYINYDTKVF